MLPEGTAAPAFTLPGTAMDRDATEISAYSLADALQRGPVVINFYLFDFLPECTEHMCSLHDLLWFDLDDRVTTAGCSCSERFVTPR